MISKNEEKKFSVLAIASITENCLLGDPEEVFDFCSFITGEHVDMGNLYRFVNTIKELIYNQYPDFCCTYVNQNKDMSDTKEKDNLNKIKQIYINNFGKKLLVKSLKKDILYKEQDKDIKKLKLTR